MCASADAICNTAEESQRFAMLHAPGLFSPSSSSLLQAPIEAGELGAVQWPSFAASVREPHLQEHIHNFLLREQLVGSLPLGNAGEQVSFVAKASDDAKCSILLVYEALLVANDVGVVQLGEKLQGVKTPQQ
jgi:hypothetical protein